jgi:hypothetical protein
MLGPLLKKLDERILSDAELNDALFEKLIERQRELGLVFADRPTCPFLGHTSSPARSTTGLRRSLRRSQSLWKKSLRMR